MNKLDLSFGEPFILTENIKKFCSPVFKWNYVSYGARSLPESTSNIVLEMIEKITGIRYKNLIITNGAQDGVNLLTRVMEHGRLRTEADLDLPHYSFHREISLKYNDNWYEDLLLSTIPSNPTGSLLPPDYSSIRATLNHIAIWDAAYFSGNYVQGNLKALVPEHDYMVGSFGKTFGLTGLRLGWIASNKDLSCVESTQRLNQLRPNHMSIGIILQVLNVMAQDDWNNLDFFFKLNYNRIQDNKTAFQPVIDKYNLQPMPVNGMFYWGGSEQFKADLDKHGVLYVDGIDCGGKNGELRLNMAVSAEIMQELVSLILKV